MLSLQRWKLRRRRKVSRNSNASEENEAVKSTRRRAIKLRFESFLNCYSLQESDGWEDGRMIVERL